MRWLISNSGDRKEGQKILPYEPFALSVESSSAPVVNGKVKTSHGATQNTATF